MHHWGCKPLQERGMPPVFCPTGFCPHRLLPPQASAPCLLPHSPLSSVPHVGTAATQVEWGGASGALASALHSKSSSSSNRSLEAEKQAVWVRMHLQGRRGRGRGRGLETLEISKTTEEDEGEEEGGEAMQE